MEQTALTATKPIKLPGPDHPIAIERNPNRVVVLVAGRIVADTLERNTRHKAGLSFGVAGEAVEHRGFGRPRCDGVDPYP